MIINGFDNIIEYSLTFLKDDYTELWIIVGAIAKENPLLSFPETVEATEQVISYLVTHHNLTLVDAAKEEPRAMSKQEILNNIRDHMYKLNRLPDIGDGVWMTV